MKAHLISKKQMANIHPHIPEAYEQWEKRTISRREFLKLATLLGMPFASAVLAVPLTETAGFAEQQRLSPENIVRGGTWRSGSFVPVIDHPARVSWPAASNILRQVGEYLTHTNSDNITEPYLLNNWQASADLKTWTLNLRQGITFNNGEELKADDVIFTFGEWLNPNVGSAMLSILSYLGGIQNVEKINDYTVRLHLQEAALSVPQDLFHYPAIILHRDFGGDFIQQPIGTGAFTLDEFVAGDRAVLKRRGDYWRYGIDGLPLPYLDELIYLSMTQDEAVNALPTDQIDTMYQPRYSDWQALKDVSTLTIRSASTASASIIRMRVDLDPWSDVRVRNALKKCLDREEILQFVYEGEGDLSIDAHVAPAHPSYCQKPTPQYDPNGAKTLLADAGYPNGLSVTLTFRNVMPDTGIAQKLKELALPGGFDITLDSVSPSDYWNAWTDVALGITPWTYRPLATSTLRLAYTQEAIGAWNETRWVDDEFEQLLLEAEGTLDLVARRQLMCQIEDIMQARGPIANAFWANVWNITRSEFVNVEAHSMHHDLLYKVRKGGDSDKDLLNNKAYLPFVSTG